MNSKVSIPDDVSHSSILQLLSDQYHRTEEYCNATTALYNTVLEQQQTVISSSSMLTVDQLQNTAPGEAERAFQLRSCIDRYQQSLTNIQNVVATMEQLTLLVRERKALIRSARHIDDDELKNDSFIRLLNISILQDHYHRTLRIVRTIYTLGEGTMYDNHGILIPRLIETRENKINVKLVALASLRASVQIVKESLPP